MKIQNKAVVAGLVTLLSLGVASGTAWAQAQDTTKMDDSGAAQHKKKQPGMKSEGNARMKEGGNAGMKAEGGAGMKAEGNGKMKAEGNAKMKGEPGMKSDHSGKMGAADSDSMMKGRHGDHMKGDHMKGDHMKGDHMKGEARNGGMSHDRGVSVRVTDQERTQFRAVFREHHVRPVEHVNFEVDIGRRIPHTVHLYRLPPRIVEIVPAYEDYEYFALADGRIAIVDPYTWEIVYILS
ncbi:MAG: hypothetical protein BGN87_16835 [Rhizobiales bacterium 65-79]|jgi:hypothetical protein|nr:DUF1236 domain-containing protein [Hyphomicrobiales bacterium]OJU06640.1 MAG: hypothetical protein BGN87_16835 [Rhizobiales bacterium 65-79]